MTLIERYILRIGLNAFVACLVALTGVIWVTQIVREFDLLTGKGQTLFVFLVVTLLSLPALVTVIAPVALFVATIYALNKLNGDSELVVMNAAGMRPLRLMRPFLTLAALVAILVSVTTFYLTPASFQELRELITRIRADFVANVVREGQFTTIDKDITFHFRERAGDALLGLFIQDRRERDRPIVYLAERGQATDVDGQSFLVLEKGSIHRQDLEKRDASIITFERYAVDLSAFVQGGGEIVYKPRERSTAQLLFPNAEEAYYREQEGRFRAELHDRLSAWLYPFAITMIAFAALGSARTTRQGRGAAMATAILAAVAMRILGFAASSAVVRAPAAVPLVYAAPLGAMALSLLAIFQAPRFSRAGARLAALVRLPLGRTPSPRRA